MIPSPWSVAIEYFHLVRNGFNPPVSGPGRERVMATVLYSTEINALSVFLHAVTAPDVAFNRGRGPNAILEFWRLSSFHHKTLGFRLVRLERGANGLVVAFADGSTTTTKKMLRTALPHLVREAKWSAIATKLVGLRLVIPSTTTFGWDNEVARIVSVHYETDMLTPLLKLLDNLENVSIVLNSAIDVQYWSRLDQ